MATNCRKPKPIAFKPDIEEVARRWEAFYEGEIIDRPIVCITAPREGFRVLPEVTLNDRLSGDFDWVIDRTLSIAEATYYAGEAVPAFKMSFGPDTIGAFCGGEMLFNPDSANTTWIEPFVEDWESVLPLSIRKENIVWKRMKKFYKMAAEKAGGKMLIQPLDLHTNMDFLAVIRGAEKLCFDLIDKPEIIDQAMMDARAIFRQIWDFISKEGRMDEFGYFQGVFSMEGAATLQCDFSCMISPDMFNRWVLPALIEESEIVKHSMYHWDGKKALVHWDSVLSVEGFDAIQFVPGAGNGDHIDYLDLLKDIQKAGKAVWVSGSIEQVKAMHRELRPEKVIYNVRASNAKEAEQLLEWFVKNT